MKLLQSLLFSLLLAMTVAAQAVSQDVQEEKLMAKISSSLKADRPADALPFFAELEGMETSLKKPLPENFHFFYIDTLEKTGNKTEALTRANAYLDKYGKKGRHSSLVIEIVSRLEVQAEKERATEIRKAQVEREAEIRKAQADREAEVRRVQESEARKKRAEREHEKHCNNADYYYKKAQEENDKCNVLAFAVGFGSASQSELDRCMAPRQEYSDRSDAERRLCNQNE